MEKKPLGFSLLSQSTQPEWESYKVCNWDLNLAPLWPLYQGTGIFQWEPLTLCL